jgi:nucleoside-diphosphate-sugar epimerase
VRLLILGGTRFLGRHVVDAALAGGHDVTGIQARKTADSLGV